MTKFLLVGIVLTGSVGCNLHKDKTVIKFVVEPQAGADTVTFTCRRSSSDSCHFAFTANMAPTEATVKVGESVVVHGDLSSNLYCAEIAKPSLETCGKTSIGSTRHVVTKETSSDESQ